MCIRDRFHSGRIYFSQYIGFLVTKNPLAELSMAVTYGWCFAQDDILALWNRSASDQATTTRIRDTLKRVLHLPANTIMEYKTHTDSLKYVFVQREKTVNIDS